MGNNDISKGWLKYKGKPLVRSGNVIYYGNSDDKFIVKMNIKKTTDDSKNDLNISSKIDVELIDISEGIYNQRVMKTSSKNNLCLALDIADIWLERALNE